VANKAANAAAHQAYSAAFRLRAKEMHGVNAKNRAAIEADAQAAARAAYITSLREQGYGVCAQGGCDRVTSPIVVNGVQKGTYVLCPGCESRKNSALSPARA
jgi:hypothetical protein